MTDAGLTASAEEMIRLLDLRPHPEGGHFRETFRDSNVDARGRAASTAIYFLLAGAQVSRWHRIDAAEIWHWYAGAPLALATATAADQAPSTRRLGSRLSQGEEPQIVVPAGHWQQAWSLGAWTLVGCTVAPGFTFDTFEMAAPDWQPGSGPRDDKI